MCLDAVDLDPPLCLRLYVGVETICPCPSSRVDLDVQLCTAFVGLQRDLDQLA